MKFNSEKAKRKIQTETQRGTNMKNEEKILKRTDKKGQARAGGKQKYEMQALEHTDTPSCPSGTMLVTWVPKKGVHHDDDGQFSFIFFLIPFFIFAHLLLSLLSTIPRLKSVGQTAPPPPTPSLHRTWWPVNFEVLYYKVSTDFTKIYKC